uniref:Uncharacterized protein n=1 Tax=Kalanchoe fedtschenkoi TaxID=63787 RepID=A0A7N0USD6_KALFE
MSYYTSTGSISSSTIREGKFWIQNYCQKRNSTILLIVRLLMRCKCWLTLCQLL